MKTKLITLSVIISTMLMVACVGSPKSGDNADSGKTSDQQDSETSVSAEEAAEEEEAGADKLAEVMATPHFKGKKCLFEIDENDKVSANDDFVAPSLVKVKHKGDHKGFIVADTIDVKVGEDTYSIELLVSKNVPHYGSKKTYGCYYDDGMIIYDRMVFSCNGKYVATYQSVSSSAWEGFEQRIYVKDWAETKKKEGADRWKHICRVIDLDENTGALCFTGALFPSDIFSMTIFIAHNGQVVPVYHKDAVIQETKEDAKGVKFECASSHVEVYEDEDGTTKKSSDGFGFDLYSQNSLMYFEAR